MWSFTIPAAGMLVLAVLLTVASPVHAETENTLYFVGDGSTTVAADPDGDNKFAIGSEGPGDATVWYTAGWPPAHAYDYESAPLFLYGGEEGPFTVLEGGPLVLRLWIEKPTNLECGLKAMVFDSAGNPLGPEDGWEPNDYPGPGGSITELIFEMDVEEGVYEGFGIHVTHSFIDCGSNLTGLHWGGSRPSGLVFGDNHFLGVPPVEDEGPKVYYENITDAPVVIEGSFEEATNATYVYNVTTDQQSVVADYAGSMDSGTVAFNITDADGVEVFTETLSEPTEANATFEGALGAWQVQVTYTDYVGSFVLELQEHVAGDGNETGVKEDPEPVGGNETADGDLEESGLIPGVGVAMVLTVVAAFVRIVRRRA